MLSTCNRTEVYAVAERFHGAYQDIRNFLAELALLPPEDVQRPPLRPLRHRGGGPPLRASPPASTRRCSARARSRARSRRRGTGPATRARPAQRLNLLFRHALEAGKRARTETGIARNITSVSQAAVAMAAERLGGLAGTRGARARRRRHGRRHGRGARRRRRRRDPRREPHAGERRSSWPSASAAEPSASATCPPQLSDVDVLLTSTGASTVLVEADELAAGHGGRGPIAAADRRHRRAARHRPGRRRLDGVTLLDMDDLRAFAEIGIASGASEVAHGRGRSSTTRSSATSAPPRLARSRRSIADLCASAPSRPPGRARALRARLDGLDDGERDAVEALTKGHHRQAAARADGRASRTPPAPPRATASSPRSASSSTSTDAGRCVVKHSLPRPAAATLASCWQDPLARWQPASLAARASTPPSRSSPSSSRPTGDRRRDVPICRARRQGRLRQGGAGGGARRAGRHRGALGQGPAVGHARRARDRGGARAGRPARRAGRLRARRPPAGAVGRDRLGSAAASSWPRLRPDLTFVDLRGQHATPASPSGGPITTRSSSPPSRARPARAGRSDRRAARPSSRCCRRSAQGALAVECRERRRRAPWRCSPASSTPPSRRASMPSARSSSELGGDCDLPAGAHATSTATRCPSRRCCARSTADVRARATAATVTDPRRASATAAPRVPARRRRRFEPPPDPSPGSVTPLSAESAVR